MNTVNRRPRLVDTPSSKQIQTQYFHQNEWKGICEDKNTFGVDQNTFAECENVYVDRDNVLTNRPGLSSVFVPVTNGYKVYTTKSYIIYCDFNTVSNSKIINIKQSVIQEPHTLTFPEGFNENELYFYEIGNILFAFGQNSLYKLNPEDYSFVDVINGNEDTNIYVPFSSDNKNLFIYNNFKVDYEIDYERKDEVLLNPQNFNSSSLQITSNTEEDIINNVITNWPYNVTKLSKSILKNASRLKTIEEQPLYENLYYINGKIYTNGGFQKSIDVRKYDSGEEMYVELYLYDDNGELVKYNNVSNYTYQLVIDNETSYNYRIVDDFWFKVDYTRSKNNILGIAISILGRETALSNQYRWYMNYVEIDFNNVNNISSSLLALNFGGYFYIAASSEDRYVPFCFYYDIDNKLTAISVSAVEWSELPPTNVVHYIAISNDNSFLSLSWSSDLTLRRANYIPYASTQNNISILTGQNYFGRVTVNHITGKLAYWTICNRFADITGIDLSTRDNHAATNTTSVIADLMGISFKNNEQLNIFTKYGNYSTEVYCSTISYDYDSQNTSVTILKTETTIANMKYPFFISAKIYLSYCLQFSNDELDVPFGVLLLNDTEYLSDVYYNSNTGEIILLSRTGKVFSNLSNSQSNIAYIFSASPNLEYTGERPTLIRPIGSNSFLYFVDNTSYILQVRYNNETLQLYLPEGKENKYYDTVIDAEQTSDKSLVVIGNNVLYSVIDTGNVDDKQLPIFQYIQSKLNLRVIENSDSIIAYNSSTLLMPTYNGIAAVNYSQLIAVEEQTVNYITDNIMTHWFNFVKSGTIKTCNHNYYLFVYNTDRTDLYMFDYRSNTWWYFTFEKKVKLMHTIGLYCFIVLEDNTLRYFDEKVLDAQWSITSQKLYLGNNTNYKQIRRFTVHTIGEKSKDYSYQSGDGDNVMTLQFTNYRKRMYENDDETFNFNVDFVRTYVIRLNYPKVYEFQYKLSSNKINLKPLNLTGITIEYKIGGKVR